MSELREVVNEFIGDIEQVPPMFSALKKNGKRLYKIARQGRVVHRDPRPVTVYSIDIIEWKNPDLRVKVRCGSGTYIRAIARDIGERLKTGGLLASLVRTRIGDYNLVDSWDLNKLQTVLNWHDANIQVN